jgi:UDP-3-O-[3-hydroxymyristoyl] glucosamine N-acyltransferase
MERTDPKRMTGPMTVARIARHVGGTLVGDESLVIRGVETLERAGSDELACIGSERYAARACESRAGAMIMSLEGTAPPGKTVIRVRDPDVALCRVLELLGPAPATVPPGVHPTAVVGKGACTDGSCIGPCVVIGEDAVIGPGTQLFAGVYVGRETKIGRDCVLWPNVVVRERVTIGDRVIIHPNATIGADGFGYLLRDGRHMKVPQIGTVVIEDDVEIGANSTVDRAKSGVTRIGRGTKIDNLVIVAHNCDIGEHCMIVAQSGAGGSVRLGHHVVLAGQAGIIDHLTIGDGAQIAAKSVVYSDVEPGAFVGGFPAHDNRAFLREQIALRKLPELLRQVKTLEARVRELEGRGESA